MKLTSTKKILQLESPKKQLLAESNIGFKIHCLNLAEVTLKLFWHSLWNPDLPKRPPLVVAGKDDIMWA